MRAFSTFSNAPQFLRPENARRQIRQTHYGLQVQLKMTSRFNASHSRSWQRPERRHLIETIFGSCMFDLRIGVSFFFSPSASCVPFKGFSAGTGSRLSVTWWLAECFSHIKSRKCVRPETIGRDLDIHETCIVEALYRSACFRRRKIDQKEQWLVSIISFAYHRDRPEAWLHSDVRKSLSLSAWNVPSAYTAVWG